MSLEETIKAKSKENFEYVEDIEELVFDSLLKIPTITQEDKKFLERFTALTYLSMNYLGLKSLENFPSLPLLSHVFFIAVMLALDER